jgi:hypothetical protein
VSAVTPIPSFRGRRYFNPSQHAQLQAVLEAIWPGSADNPGATDAGAADYVDQLLAMPDSVYYDLANWRSMYVAGLAMLAGASPARFSTPLEKLTVAQMTQLLADLAAGTLQGFPSDTWQKSFFATLRGHCIEGCLADPRWGGNRDGVIWKWLGYPRGGACDFQAPAPAPAGNGGTL